MIDFTKMSFLRVFTMMYHKKRCKDKTFLSNHSYVSQDFIIFAPEKDNE